MDEEASNYDNTTSERSKNGLSKEEKWAAALIVGVWVVGIYLLIFQ